jgi:two-component sensor histidine kinase
MIRILHLEDNDNDAELICEMLSRDVIDWRVTRVETREAFLEAIDHSDWDIIMADYSLPGFDGISALKLSVEKHPNVPFIFVTGLMGEELAVQTLKCGATDYILKHRLECLPLAVARAIRESDTARARIEAERNLKASLREKELLLQEVHHRVKNNLQVIISLLNMQSRVVNDPLLTAALQESQKRVWSMAMIHEMLYSSSSPENVDFAAYAQVLATEVSSSYGIDPARIRLALDLEPLSFEMDCAIPCGLILNELLSNAFKHAFPNGRTGEVRVSLQRRERYIRLAVEDTGIGLPRDRVPAKGKSLGLSIIDILTQQLGGSMEFTSNQGSHFVLTFAEKWIRQKIVVESGSRKLPGDPYTPTIATTV